MAEPTSEPIQTATLRCSSGDCRRVLIVPAVSVKDRGSWLHYCLGCEPK